MNPETERPRDGRTRTLWAFSRLLAVAVTMLDSQNWTILVRTEVAP